MSSTPRRITRSMKNLEEDAHRQVSDPCESMIDTIVDANSCHASRVGSIKLLAGFKDDLYDARSVTSRMSQLDIGAQLELEEESARLELEAKLMRKRAEVMERRSAMLKESSVELGMPICKEELQNDRVQSDRMNRFLKDCECRPKVDQQYIVEPQIERKVIVDQNIDVLRDVNRPELPKVELPRFGGDMNEYWSFIRQFEIHVETSTTDPKRRLLYLLNYCYGQAKEAISGCAIMSPEEGYREARSLLKRLFGRCHVVSRRLIEEVLNLPKIQRYDEQALTRLFVKMNTCWKTLNQMGYLADINAVGTIQRIVDKLPEDMNDRWIRETYYIYEDGREPEFEDLIKFIDKEAAIAQTRYAESKKLNDRFGRSKIEARTPDNRRTGFDRVMNHIDNASGSKEPFRSCMVCDGEHRMTQCNLYIEMPVTKRWEIVKTKGGCFSCLATGHTVKHCKYRKQCGIEGCVKRHHVSLHSTMKTDIPKGDVFTSLGVAEREVALGILPVKLIGPKGQITINALLDTGANTTLIRKDVSNKVGISGHRTAITINTVTGESKVTAIRCNFIVRDLKGEDSVNITNAFAVDNLPLKLSAGSNAGMINRWPHLSGIPEHKQEDRQVVMIIGCDQPKAHWVSDLKNGSESQPFGIKTPLGWVILGPVHRECIRSVNAIQYSEIKDDTKLETMIERLYNQDFDDLGSTDKEMSREERIAVDLVSEGTINHLGHYIVPLPWERYPPRLSNNKQYAIKRLLSLRRRFLAHPGLALRYNEIFMGHVEKGYIAKVQALEASENGNAWYLPHHPVFNPRKPDKLRIVFDCAAKYLGRSINDCLHQGPDTIASLVGVLLRFRRLPVGIMADIEEMFLQVRLPEQDQNWMRFLWWERGNIESQIEEYKMLVHPFGARSSPFCANYALNRTVLDNENKISKDTAEIAKRNIYVDDCIASVMDASTAKRIMSELTDLMSKGGFKLKKWLSNDREALAEIPLENLARDVQLLADRELPAERALGVEWNSETDQLKFKFVGSDKPNTRRGMLGTVASVFDPLGLIAPIILKAKILLQALCRERLEWDQPLVGETLGLWTDWKEQMTNIQNLKFPRCVRHSKVSEGELQLHLFADASEVGYGAVAYTRMEIDGAYQCNILMSKARVAPLKTVTIPRLELNAAVLAIRLSKLIIKEFGEVFEGVYFWVDSTIVLRYLNNTTSRFVTFVANRVQEILESSNVSQWRHVPSEYNPADYASRGLTVDDPRIKVWMGGPAFLNGPDYGWPKPIGQDNDEEILETKGTVLHTEAIVETAMDRVLQYYSSWHGMIKAVAWLTRYKQYLRVMICKQGTIKVGKLKVEELESAERDILSYVQRTVFPEEFNATLDIGKHVAGFSWHRSRLRKLCPRASNGLMRVSGRCYETGKIDSNKLPVILPPIHPVTSAIVRYFHEREGHSGVSHTLAQIRENMWILHGGAAVKRVLRKCLTCRRMNAVSMKQRMAELPRERVSMGWYPFQYVGVDFFGPFQVRRGRLLEKRYGCIFTCLQCRAIHLELAQSLSTDSFILALMRFVNRRGVPKEVRSDNGGNFIGAERELGEWLARLDQDKITEMMTEKRITWKFNPPLASHRGGIWERMIRSVRKILNSVAGRGSMNEEVLWTYLTQAERIINDRPLTAVREEQSEPTPIRPSDLIQPKGKDFIAINLPLSQLVEKRWRIVNNLTSEFWNRWKAEYLSALQERQIWFAEHLELKVGDLVITEVESTPRTYWPLGIIEEVLADSDGNVRTVNVRTSSGIVKRDIRKVYLLEGVG